MTFTLLTRAVWEQMTTSRDRRGIVCVAPSFLRNCCRLRAPLNAPVGTWKELAVGDFILRFSLSKVWFLQLLLCLLGDKASILLLAPPSWMAWLEQPIGHLGYRRSRIAELLWGLPPHVDSLSDTGNAGALIVLRFGSLRRCCHYH